MRKNFKFGCLVVGCKNPIHARDLCPKHYQRWRTTGSLVRTVPEYSDPNKSLQEYLVEKFLSGIRKLPNGCWVCDTAMPVGEYREVVIDCESRGKVREYVHRLSYRHFKGKIPKGRHILHSCDNPPCCNPGHLSAGTREQNMQDMVNKGRHYRGQNNRPAFLTEADVVAMYQLQDQGGVSQYEIGRRFGVNERYVWLILHGKRWKYLYRKHRPSASV